VSEGYWAWATGEPWIFSAWDATQPDNSGGENCLERQRSDGNWNDVPCTFNQHRLCERAKLPKLLSIDAPCPPTFGPGTYTDTYEPNCGPGKAVQWGFLGWTTSTPSDSPVEFSFKVAADLASLPSIMYIPVGTASAANTNEICSITAPSGSCPIDLFVSLGGLPNARYPVAQIQIVTNPASGGTPSPTVTDWTITYSCVDSE
jgi:hypothetical protein